MPPGAFIFIQTFIQCVTAVLDFQDVADIFGNKPRFAILGHNSNRGVLVDLYGFIHTIILPFCFVCRTAPCCPAVVVNEQKSCRERIEASLIYDSLENFKIEDINDKLIGLAVIYHSCIEAGLDPKYEFEYIASLSSYKFAKFLRDFIKRSPKDKSLKAFFLKSQRNINHEVEIFPSWTNSQ